MVLKEKITIKFSKLEKNLKIIEIEKNCWSKYDFYSSYLYVGSALLNKVLIVI